MSGAEPVMSVGRFGLKAVNTLIGVVALTASLTVLFLCARTVMDMGGSCASGGPYVVARPCPKGVGWMTPVSILLGLVSIGWMMAWDAGLPGPKWAAFAWPALFLSLGWNFWEYGLDGPGDQGVVAGWIVCGVLFVLMGGAPLLALGSREARRSAFWSDAPPSTEGREILRPTARTVVRAVTPTFPKRSPTPPPPAPPARPFGPMGGDVSSDMVTELQRLAALHRSGDLTDEEFAIAKQRILRAT